MHIKQGMVADSMYYGKGESAQNEIQTLLEFSCYLWLIL